MFFFLNMIEAIRNTLRPGGAPTINKFIRQNFASATSFKTVLARF